MGKSKIKTKQTNTLDPEIKARLFDSTDDVTAAADASLGGGASLAAPRTETFTKFLNKAGAPDITGTDFRNIGDQFKNQPTLKFNASGPAVAALGSYDRADYAATPNYAQANYAATPDYGDGPQIAAQMGYTKMDPYMSKYTQDVVDTSLGDLGAQRQKTQLLSDLAASASGAAGGSRHGVRDAEVSNDYLRNVASTTANLRNQGFNTAAQLGMSDAERGLSADQYNAANQMQKLGSLFGANTARNAAMFNADNTRNASLFGAGTARNANIFGADNTRNASLFAAQNALNDSNALRAQNQGQFTSTGDFEAQTGNADLYNRGLLGQQGVLESGSGIDARNTGLLGTAAQIDQEQENQNSPMNALKLKLAAAGLLPAITNSEQTTTQKPGAFDWLSLAASAAAKGKCWVAREVYGESNPAWLVFREWLSTAAPKPLLALYNKYGERFAGFIRNKPRVKSIIRRLMNLVVEK